MFSESSVTTKTTAAVIAAFVLLCPEVSAQTGSDDAPATFGGHLGVMSANAIAGGVTGAVRALLTGGDVSRAVTRGMVGGAVVYLGKTVATSHWDGAAFTGRAIAGFGSDVVRAATDTTPLLPQLELAIGPVRVRPVRARGAPRIRLNVFQSAMLMRALVEPGMRLDWGRSVGSGTPIFVTHGTVLRHDGKAPGGIYTSGFVVIQDRLVHEMDQTFRHEMIHVLQYDFFERAWVDPVEDALRRAHPWTRRVPDWMQAGLMAPALFGLIGVFLDQDQGVRGLIEEEAAWFENR
jgi:hypothetical protein